MNTITTATGEQQYNHFNKNNIILYLFVYLYLYKKKDVVVRSGIFKSLAKQLGIKVSKSKIKTETETMDLIFNLLKPYVIFVGYTELLKKLDIYPFTPRVYLFKPKAQAKAKAIVNTQSIITDFELLDAFDKKDKAKLNKLAASGDPSVINSLFTLEYLSANPNMKNVPLDNAVLMQIYAKHNVSLRLNNKKEYRKLSLIYHPDKNSGGKTIEEAKAINVIHNMFEAVYK